MRGPRWDYSFVGISCCCLYVYCTPNKEQCYVMDRNNNVHCYFTKPTKPNSPKCKTTLCLLCLTYVSFVCLHNGNVLRVIILLRLTHRDRHKMSTTLAWQIDSESSLVPIMVRCHGRKPLPEAIISYFICNICFTIPQQEKKHVCNPTEGRLVSMVRLCMVDS